jgi:hypothetical protein
LSPASDNRSTGEKVEVESDIAVRQGLEGNLLEGYEIETIKFAPLRCYLDLADTQNVVIFAVLSSSC